MLKDDVLNNFAALKTLQNPNIFTVYNYVPLHQNKKMLLITLKSSCHIARLCMCYLQYVAFSKYSSCLDEAIQVQ